ncbi:hypothetical protein TUBRATIS_22930 [Tubulinosema ratisbonensis]|uniref:Uncharacterized protein n=1 Tax=Tubulinosema ratisbonensis TaxID=291195 RepID=A0A437AJD8_9MICR|nr:hypothetical protein TUBRATIS_22930 [Tubulinosema ratisbonensis]
MKMRLLELLESLPSNPKLITAVENEVERILRQEPIEYIIEAFKIDEHNLRFYFLVILEKRMYILRENNQSLIEVINAAEFIILNYEFKGIDEKKFAKIYAKIGLYSWPGCYPNFLNILIELIKFRKKIGFLILENFLYLMHNSIEIDENRRSELKRAMIIMKDNLLQLISDGFCLEEVILIYTHLISILPKPIDFKIILERGNLFPEKASEFFLEAINSKYNDFEFFNNLVGFAELVDVEPKMIECFLNLKRAHFCKNLQLYAYIFKGISKNIHSFSLSLQFWIILFRKGMQDELFYSLAMQILQEVIRVVVTFQDDDCNSIKIEDLESYLITLFGIISQNYQSANHLFLTKFVNDIPRKYAIILLKANKHKHTLPLNCSYLKALSLYLDNDPQATDFMARLDLNDKDSCKLIGQIVKKFYIDKYKLINLFNSLKERDYVEEAIVNIILKLEDMTLIKQVLEGDMDLKKAHILFYFLKHNPEVMSEEINKFFIFFINNPPFDRSFSIVALIYKNYGVPNEIWENIFNSIENISLKDLNYFCVDLLQKLNEELQIPFVEKIFRRLLNEWNELDDEIEVSNTTKSFIAVLENLIVKNLKSKNEINYTNLLIEFLQFTNPQILLKIYGFYNRVKFNFETERLTLKLLMCYNSFEMVDCQTEIITLLIECLKKEDGPSVFQKFNFNPEKIQKIYEFLKNASIKRSRTLIKELLNDIKGKPLSNLYQPTNKIQSQNLFSGSSKKKDDNDFVFPNIYQ